MKHLLAYVIWNKANMLEWLIDGIVESFHPDDVDLLFVLDNPVDGTEKELNKLVDKLNFSVYIKNFDKEMFKFPCQNFAMQHALELNYTSVICPQDDQRIKDKYLIQNINKCFEKYGESLGVIGLRDGFDFGYQNLFSSEWSESTLTTTPRLTNGETIEVKLINDGGIVYPTHLIKAIGLNDTSLYERFYIEDDYAMNAYVNGYTNLVMGNSLIHDRTMSSVASSNYSDNFAERDLIKFKTKWKL